MDGLKHSIEACLRADESQKSKCRAELVDLVANRHDLVANFLCDIWDELTRMKRKLNETSRRAASTSDDEYMHQLKAGD